MQNKDYPKLLECPFCGGEAELCKIIVNYDYNVWAYRCGCKKCDISVEGNKKRVIDLWNTRTPKRGEDNV